ncbi:hypothetical protein QR680_006311 [Steinernema hermaphroditum]|uniref:BPTI/Kunitz inhibitor domain-containing protein n=1 Tax=Steinernema hermaphroditum TaxID=289476 RepID=A0AA39HX85_9BILA|nr:hypothetical protein QR680_006311 [Steinernema hermaphroditum]
MLSSHRRAFGALLVVTLLVNVAVADDASFIAAMRNLIFGSQQQNETQSPATQPHKALHPGHYSLQPQLSSVENAQLGYPQPPAVFNSYQPSQFVPSVGGSACQLPQQIGTGRYSIPRWYFNPNRMRCELFYWSGCCGNANNFETFQACQQVCEDNTFVLNSPAIAQPTAAACCLLPYSPGVGVFQIPRWYFEPSTGSCHLYLFRGGGESENSFQSVEECECMCRQCRRTQGTTNIVVILPPVQVDPCTQDRDQGVGALQLSRYFFNSKTKMCEQFVYFGSGGNRNNFAMLEECQKTCPESPNPCAYGNAPAVTQCAPGSVLTTTCNGNQFCHVGATPTTTVCCNKPANVDRCNQPLNIGVGNANLQRWYFNPLTQQCQSCIYKGLQGNENNFLTQQECQNACVVNPCARGFPYRNQGVTQQCSAANQAICPAGYYCHVGATAQTSVCCQALATSFDVCRLPKKRGSGSDLQKRFYYNAKKKRCETFIYGGKEGNANNFETIQRCKALCYGDMINACPSGSALVDEDTDSTRRCDLNFDCPSGHWCHKSDRSQPGVCCPTGDVHPCLLPHSISGRGTKSIQRWTYHIDRSSCGPFEYSGRKGNANNFATKEECEQICPVFGNPCPFEKPVTRPMEFDLPYPVNCSRSEDCPEDSWCHVSSKEAFCCPGDGDPCAVPVNLGEGEERILRYGYDIKRKECFEFEYYGSKGNMNNFLTKEMCELRCPVYVNPCGDGEHPEKDSNGDIRLCYADNVCGPQYTCTKGINPPSTVCCPLRVRSPIHTQIIVDNPCEHLISRGYGTRRIIRYGFDASVGRCVPFAYAGTFGNSNNFLTLEECHQRCPGAPTVCPNPPGPSEPIPCPEGRCPDGFWCHVGADRLTTQCCLKNVSDPCSEAMNKGEGDLSLTRFYFDTTRRQCFAFNYFGTKGNSNNFVTKEDCEKRCPIWVNPCAYGDPLEGAQGMPQQCQHRAPCPIGYYCHIGYEDSTSVCCPSKAKDPCQVPMNVGIGALSMTRWFYNAQTRKCQQFSYSGSKGNENNFLLREHCEDTCPVWENPCPVGEPILAPNQRPQQCVIGSSASCPKTHWCHPGSDPASTVCCPGQQDPCMLMKSEGEGKFMLQRYYFDLKEKQCRPFTFRGIKGNANNFLSKKDCENMCPVWVNPCPMPSSNGISFHSLKRELRLSGLLLVSHRKQTRNVDLLP